MLRSTPQAGHFSSPKFLHLIQRSLLLLIGTLLSMSTLVAQSNQNSPQLEVGKPIERELTGGLAHSYLIALKSGQFLRVIVDQRGIDVVMTLFGPDGAQVQKVDAPNGTQGNEAISLIVEVTGSYRLEVNSPDETAPAGRYEARIDELRLVTADDKTRVEAERAFMEGERLRGLGSRESLREALTKYEEAAPRWRAVNNRDEEAVTLNNMGLVYDVLGEKQKALDFHNQALTIARATGNQRLEGTIFNNIGRVYDLLGEKQKALDHYNLALSRRRAVGDKSGEAVTLNNMGSLYSSLGESQKALDHFNQALPIWQAVGERRSEAVTLNNISQVYQSLGEMQKALDISYRVLPLLRRVGDRRAEASVLTSIGSIYKTLGELELALDFYNQSLPLTRATGYRNGEVTVLNNIGTIYNSMGELQKALEFHTLALPITRAIGDRRSEATALSSIGTIYKSLNQLPRALDFHNQALALRRALGDRGGEAIILNNIGVVYDALSEKQKALDYYIQALQFTRATGERSNEASTLANIAAVERDRGNLKEARTRIEDALTIVESLRTKIASQELRSSYFATVQKYYDIYIDVLMRLHKQQPSEGFDGTALQASERGRARSLLETLSEANADIRQGVDPTLVARERSLQLQLNAKAQQQTKLLNGKHTEAQAEVMTKEIVAITTAFQQVESEIRQKSPNYAALTQPEPLTLKEIQNAVLDKDTVLLEYSLGEEHSYLWAVTPTSITSYELPKRVEIEMLARQVYALLTDAKRWKTRDAAGQRILTMEDEKQAAASLDDAKRLSQMLLAPIAAQLGKKRLLIIADGALQYIPFGALPTPQLTTARKNAAAYHPLIIEHEIVSLPSASTLAVLRQQVKDRKPAAKAVAVLADPVFESNDVRVSQKTKGSDGTAPDKPTVSEKRELPIGLERSAGESGLRDAESKIPRLPGTRAEAMQILSLVPPAQRKQAFDFVANRQTATSDELSQYRYVHFATHGFLNAIHPELSGLVFSMVDEKGQPQDGFLRAHEIFNLKLPAELVVLSACQTGLGKEIKGEGLVGLTRGFMYAGSPRVVVSLWSVSDQATAELMTRFYRGILKGGLRPAAALRAAQVSLMKEKKWEAPFYWAAFTLQGEWK